MQNKLRFKHDYPRTTKISNELLKKNHSYIPLIILLYPPPVPSSKYEEKISLITLYPSLFEHKLRYNLVIYEINK
jgi:hypothetical protein